VRARPSEPHRPKKSLGQNFLIDPNLQRKIVTALAPGPDDEILEIGPGRGALTDHLVGMPRRLTLVELDDRLSEELQVRYEGRADVHVVHADFLKVDIRSLTERPEELKVVGNIPYNVTAPIVFRLLEPPRPAEIVLMVQREVAQRMAASPGTAEYGALTVGVQSVARVETLFKVPRTAFRPVPRVDSSVVRLVPRRPAPMSPEEEARLRELTRVAFGWRRKQFQKTLRDHPRYRLPREAVERLEAESGLDLTGRPETFSPGSFLTLSRLLARAGPHPNEA
jgi:16S rRNA (adenine1518-N6/adenine1519-N6)-dimethyltransferase